MMKHKISIWVIGLAFLLGSCGDHNNFLKGYMNQVSYNPADTAQLFFNIKKQNENEPLVLLDVKGRKIKSFATKAIPSKSNENRVWMNSPKYKNVFKLPVAGLQSGIYYFDRSSPFIIKPHKKSESKVLIVYPSNTVNAYNRYGGRSAYTDKKADAFTFQRPMGFDKYSLPFLRWMADQDFKVDYICDRDMDNFNLNKYKVIIISGHSEYWTRKARRNFDSYINQGGHGVILSGNTMWYQVRYEKDKMIVYKDYEKDAFAPDSLKTISWGEKRLNYPIEESIGLSFSYGGYGLKKDKGWNGYYIVNDSPLFKHTRIKVGDTLSVPTAEYDGANLSFLEGVPRIINQRFMKSSLLGYDRAKGKANYGVFGVFKKNDSSGIIINVGSTNWCSDGFKGRDSEKIKKLTYNFIHYLLNDIPVFTD